MSKVGIKSLRVHEGSSSEQTAIHSNINTMELLLISGVIQFY